MMGGEGVSHILQQLVLMAVPVLLAITFHEVAHGWVADRLGDATARLQGRLSLNPLVHVDPVGTVLIPILLFVTTGFVLGYARPVPVNFWNLRNPKRDMVWVAAAGPATNLVLALLFGLAFQGLLWGVPGLGRSLSQELGGGGVHFFLVPLALMCLEGVKWNVLLAVFNLIPIPPLDGGRILVGLLPPRPSEVLSRVEPYGFFLILILVVLDPLGLFRGLIGPMLSWLTRWFSGIPLF